MIPENELRKIAEVRLKDAEILYSKGQYDSAVYICGYAVEIIFKARICLTLKWNGYPSTRAEFQNYQSFKTHDLDVLLHLSGVESQIRSRYIKEWSDITRWDTEVRYRIVGTTGQSETFNMIESAKKLVRAL